MTDFDMLDEHLAAAAWPSEIRTLPSGANLRGWIGAAKPARDLLRQDIARHS
jgi:hypothetical protein